MKQLGEKIMSDKKKKTKDTNKFYNKHLFKSILELSDVDVLEGLKRFENYLEIYPKDNTAQCFYASNLIKVRRFEEAEEILDKVEKMYKNPNFDEKKEELIYKNLCFTKMKLLCYQERYKECINFCNEHHDILQKYEVGYGAVIHYCLTKLDNTVTRNYVSAADKYFFQQLDNYSEDEVKRHVYDHLADCKAEENEEITGFFFKGFPFDKVFEKLKECIPDEEKGYCFGFMDNTYFFRYDGCGRCLTEKDRKNSKDRNYQSNLMVTDYFKVSTFHNSSNIITICPCENTQGLPYTDLNYLKDEEIEKSPMVKKKSKRDKFYERYPNIINK